MEAITPSDQLSYTHGISIKFDRSFFNRYFWFSLICLLLLLFCTTCNKGTKLVPEPEVNGVSPLTGTVGTVVTISGDNFSSVLSENEVKFNGTTATIQSATKTTLGTTVPAGASSGKITIRVKEKTITFPTDFMVIISPAISGFNPQSGTIGTVVTISGDNFSSVLSENEVKFNGVTAIIQSVTKTTIVTAVPEGASSGKITIRVREKTIAFPTDFIVIIPPAISGFTPKSGTMGSQITLTGTNFNLVSSGNLVRINNQIATVINSSPTELKIIVPEGACTGKISLTIGETTTTTMDNFTVSDFENKFDVRGLYVQFDRRNASAGYYTGQVIRDFNNFESSLGHTVAEEVSLQLDEMKKIGVNTIVLELRASDPYWGDGYYYPSCYVHEALGLNYPVPAYSEITNLVALFDLVNDKQIKIMLRLVNTNMEEQPPLNNAKWISAILNAVKNHPALDLVLFEGNTRVVDSDGDGKKDQCGLPAEPPLWQGPASAQAKYVKWAIQYGISLGIPPNKLSAECVVGFYVIDKETATGPDATDHRFWHTVKILKQIFDELAIQENQRTYAISLYQQRKCENAYNEPCVDAEPSVWAEETWKNVFEIIGRNNQRVVAVEFGLYKNYSNWTTEQAFESQIQLMKRYGVAGGCFWRWVFADNNETNDPTLTTPVKKRGMTFEYSPVKDKMAQYYLSK